jgi:acetyl esterase/lipase
VREPRAVFLLESFFTLSKNSTLTRVEAPLFGAFLRIDTLFQEIAFDRRRQGSCQATRPRAAHLPRATVVVAPYAVVQTSRKVRVPTMPPRRIQPKRGIGKPIYPPSMWSQLPTWIQLHAERGKVRKCWEGHRLLRDVQDGRKHGDCDCCRQRPWAGSPILSCSHCKFTVCGTCNSERPRLPPLSGDPLFCGPHSPRLLLSPHAVAGMGKGTVIVCPGGNYEFLSPKEGLPVVEWLAQHGIMAVVLRYRLLPHHDLQDALDDLDAAAALVRSARGGPVAAIGFSAGGHLVASHSIRTEQRRMESVHTRRKARALDAQLLIYPAIDGTPWLDPEAADFFNRGEGGLPKKAGALDEPTEGLLGGPGFRAPPTFLVGSTGDSICPPKEHSDLYADALTKHDVPHVYIRRNLGDHGFTLGESPSEWTARAVKWLRHEGFGAPGEEEEEASPSRQSPLTLPETACAPGQISLLPVHTSW